MNRGAHCGDVPRVDRDNEGGCGHTFPGLNVRVEVSGGEDGTVFGVEDRLREAREMFLRVFWKETDGEGIDGELGLVGGEAEWQPGRLSHWERFVELAG